MIVSVFKKVQLIFGRAKTSMLRMNCADLVRQVFKIWYSPRRLDFCANNICSYALLKILAFSVDSNP